MSWFRYKHRCVLILYAIEAHEQAVRALSEKFGISIARVEAIIRLKQYEQEYQKVRIGYVSFRFLHFI